MNTLHYCSSLVWRNLNCLLFDLCALCYVSIGIKKEVEKKNRYIALKVSVDIRCTNEPPLAHYLSQISTQT